MTGLVLGLLVVGAVVGIGAAVAFVFGAATIGRKAKQDLRLVPGTPARVPDHWFGSHDREAVLYRRLLQAIRGVQTAAGDQPGTSDTVASLEQQALGIEAQLVGVTLIAPTLRTPVLEQLAVTVADVERICSEVVGREAGWSRPEVRRQLDDLAERLELIDRARAELEQTEPGL